MQPQKPTSNRPNPPAPAAPAIDRRRRLRVAGGAAAAMVLVCGITLWAVTREEDPRLNEDTVTLVKFVSGDRYAGLPFARQTEYMKVLEDRDDNDELEAAFEAGKLSEAEYRAALLEAWLGQQVKRAEKYASLPPGPARDKYIAGLLDKKDAKKARKAAKGGSGNEPEIKRDKAVQEARIAAWPVDMRTKWQQYRRDYDAQKEAREAAAADDGAAGS